MVTHRNVVSFNANMTSIFGLQPADRIYALTTIPFDISVLELLNSLMSGLSLVMAPQVEILAPAKILATLHQEQISVLQLTPTRLNLLLENQDPTVLASLRVLLIGGEPLPPDLFERLRP